MSFPQTLARMFFPSSLYDEVCNSSKHWMIQCTLCGKERSVWDAGGIRWRAASIGKRIPAHCSHCDKLVAARIYYKDEVDAETDA
ncbi:hypothetical protein [Rhodopirellula sp. MGV]|uniref:hypothetical protein n=1 Tax=Rhodopirellula sp. MGV TaxID=2023130 RepID=UPI000B95D3BF|nr:hypothetical protein [Rhodopirellula sp. MGV]OYP36573.1 hypothetical protein CGZ80_08055 [Rhodopirellula sp. MGV]PNY34550.1 hypothetical protein C2E31_22870 [Rhodopirellula baltica]